MRRWGVCALGLALVLGLAAGAAEPDDDAGPAAAKSTDNWFTHRFSFGKQAPAKKAADAKPKADAAASTKMAAREAAAAQRARDEADLLRRQGVCLKLRTIAAQTNNDELRRKADQLDEQAWNIYLRRTASLPGGAGESLDEATLERHLGRDTGRAEASPASASRGMSGQAAARGELP
jgi:hypothetical protein